MSLRHNSEETLGNEKACSSVGETWDVLRENRAETRLKEFMDGLGLSSFGREVVSLWLTKIAGENVPSSSSEESNRWEEHRRDIFPHVRQWLMLKLNHRHLPKDLHTISPWQHGCPDIVPGLQSEAFWDVTKLPGLSAIQQNYQLIKREFLALRGASKRCQGFQPYRSPIWSKSAIKADDGIGGVSHDSGDWNVFYLYLHNVDCAINRARCPRTSELINNVLGHYHHAFFSVLARQTHILKHHGPTTKKLRCHLPLVVPPGGCKLRVGDQMKQMIEGELYVFDDSFEHEVWNQDSNCSRMVLIFDIWHPDLTVPEVRFLNLLQRSQLHAEQKRCSQDMSDKEQKENFYSILKQASELPVDEQALWAGTYE